MVGRVSNPEKPEHSLAASRSAVAFPRAVRGGGANICFIPGDGQGMMKAYVV